MGTIVAAPSEQDQFITGISASEVSRKAGSLRARNLARMEHDAHQRTEQMGLPMVVLFISFLVFIGYPAMAQTMGSL